MNITTILQKDLIIVDVRARRKRDVIEELAAHLVKQLDEVRQDDIVRALSEREQIGTTAIGDGLAVPHCKLDSVNDLIACLGRSHKGINFGAANDQRTHFFFLLVSPADSAGHHLKALAQISRMFGDSEFRSRLMAAETAEEIHRILLEKESQ